MLLVADFSCAGGGAALEACPTGTANPNGGQVDSSACAACTGVKYAENTGTGYCTVSILICTLWPGER